MGGYAQGGRIAAPIFKQFAKTAFAGRPKIPFVAPPGIRMVRIDRATGKRVFGTFPTEEDPEVVGHLGGVPAGDRAAPLVPPKPGRRRRGAGRRRAAGGKHGKMVRRTRPAQPRQRPGGDTAEQSLANAGRHLLGERKR